MIAITGITGRTGRFLLHEINSREKETKELIEKYGGFRALVRNSSNLNMFANSNFPIELFTGNLDNMNDLIEFTKNCDVILHITNIRKSLPVLKAAIKNQLKRVILVHTTGIYSKFKCASEEYKIIEEQIYSLSREHNIHLTILRPTMIYGSVKDGNMIKFIKMVDTLKIIPVVKNAEFFLQPVNAEDLGKAYFDVLYYEDKTRGNDYILSGDKPILLKDILNEIANNLGKKRTYINIPFPLAYAGAVFIYLVTFEKKDLREKVQRLCEHRNFDHTDATKDFGYSPMPFPVGIKKEIKEYIRGKN